MMKRFALIILLFVSTQADAQTAWFKYDGNPVIAPGSPGTWDNGGVLPGRVVREDSLYVMWYSGFRNFMQTGRATSFDGATWTKDARNPVLQNGPTVWDNQGSHSVYVIRSGTEYKMWYTGDSITVMSFVPSPETNVCYATSSDGINWKKSSANPLIRGASWYAAGPLCPSILGPDSTGGYKMWFQGDPRVHAQFQIGYATATDETTWTVRPDPVLSWGTPGSWDDDKVMTPKVLFDGQRYEMFYSGERALNVDPRTHIGYATSPDGVTWTRDGRNPVLKRGAGFDASDIYCLDVIRDGGLYHMWWGGVQSDNNRIFRVGYAVSPKGFGSKIEPNDSAAKTFSDSAGSVFMAVGDSLRILVQVDSPPPSLAFAAYIDSSAGRIKFRKDTVQLYDDGLHGDSLARDGLFANRWRATFAGTYLVSVSLTLNDTLHFTRADVVDGFTVDVDRSGNTSALSLPQKYILEQNYPNPFNPSTQIKYTVGGSGGWGLGTRVKLVVYDLLGREVAILVNERKPPGSYDVTFDASGLSSGVYFYKLSAGDFVQTRSMVVLR